MTRTLHVRSAADVDRLAPHVRAQVLARHRAERGPRVLDPAWDAESRQVAALSVDDLAAELARGTDRDRRRLRRMRWRWDLGAFAEAVVRPIMARRSTWAAPNPVIRDIYGWPLDHWRGREAGTTAQYLVWAPRGAAKTTAISTRALHAALFGLEAGIIVVGSGDTAARGILRTIAGWVAELPAEARELWPDVAMAGPAERLTLTADGHAVTFHARGWLSQQIRGLQEGAVRPTLAILDDIESAGTTSSQEVRDKSQAKLTEQVLPLLPLDGRGAVLWSATPVHADCLSARAFKRAPGFARWATVRHRAVRAWPQRADLWEAARRTYLDIDAAASALTARGEVVTPDAVQREQGAAVRRMVEAHPEMTEGADVLDPVRLPILACYMRRWDVGEESWAREYQTEAVVRLPDATFDSSAWVRVPIRDGAVVTRSGAYQLARLQLVAYYDPSDGGDPGALAVGARLPDGRCVVLHVVEMRMRMPDQIGRVVADCDAHDVRTLTAEQNMMHAGEQAQLAAAVAVVNRKRAGAGKPAIALRFQATHEDKDQRVRSLDHPLSTGRMLVAGSVPAVLGERADAWRPGGHSVDDVLDAAQRVGEMCGVIADPRNQPARVVRGLAF